MRRGRQAGEADHYRRRHADATALHELSFSDPGRRINNGPRIRRTCARLSIGRHRSAAVPAVADPPIPAPARVEVRDREPVTAAAVSPGAAAALAALEDVVREDVAAG